MKYIFLHGLGQMSQDWRQTRESLMINTNDILCPNLSDWIVDIEVNYFTLYQKMEEYCAQFDEPLNLCGLSLGGVLAMQYTIDHPDKVHSLVLIGSQYCMPKMLLNLQNIIFHFMPDAMFSKIGFSKSDFINLCKSMKHLDFTNDLNRISCPTMIIFGEKDLINKKAAYDLNSTIENSKIKVILDSGHEVNKDAPITLSAALNNFYNEFLCFESRL